MVRIRGIDPTRPDREMQSGIRCRSALACSCTIATQHNTSNSNRLQATGESVMRPELTGSSLGHYEASCSRLNASGYSSARGQTNIQLISHRQLPARPARIAAMTIVAKTERGTGRANNLSGKYQ